MAIPVIPDIRTLVEAGVHFGHASGKWHPKMKPYIFVARDKLHIINLEKTQEQLNKVLPVLEERVRSGKTLVLVGTKPQVSEMVKEMGERLNIPYVNVRWLGGTMTNFGEIQKSIARMKKIEAYLESGESASMIKKERVMMENELKRMRSKFGGLRNLTKKPDILFIIDPGHEHNAVKEGSFQKLELFGLVDTDSNPDLIHHIIPMNDDGSKSLKLILGLVEQTIANGQKLISVKVEEKNIQDNSVLSAEKSNGTDTIQKTDSQLEGDGESKQKEIVNESKMDDGKIQKKAVPEKKLK